MMVKLVFLNLTPLIDLGLINKTLFIFKKLIHTECMEKKETKHKKSWEFLY